MIEHVWRPPLGSKNARTVLAERACAFAGCGQPKAAHERVVDWGFYRQCPNCFAELGKPCLRMSGWSAGVAVAVEADRPHGGRKLRAGATR